MSRKIFAISDLHVDYKENEAIVQSWSSEKYGEDILLLAGDVTDNVQLMRKTLTFLSDVFYKVFLVPGNHDLWIRPGDTSMQFSDSVGKFHYIVNMCQQIGISTEPEKIVNKEKAQSVWIVPLFSWYATPEDDLDDSLYIKPTKYEEDIELNQMTWMDNKLCKWPDLEGSTVSKYFSKLNRTAVAHLYDAPVISFSHFIPRKDLILASEDEQKKCSKERVFLGLPKEFPPLQGAVKEFNFTRYAGCNILESQIRSLGSRVHVHGHQHRNRDRMIDGVHYISHCLGYKRERDQGLLWGLREWQGPKQIWPQPCSEP